MSDKKNIFAVTLHFIVGNPTAHTYDEDTITDRLDAFIGNIEDDFQKYLSDEEVTVNVEYVGRRIVKL